MEPEAVEALFTRSDGTYLFARWERPIVPVVFGLAEESLPVVKGAIEAVVTLAGHEMAEADPELGANLMLFAFRDWAELLAVPDLDQLVPELAGVVGRLQAAEANQYRVFRFEANGAIKAVFVFLRMDAALAEMEAGTLAMAQAVQVILLWSDCAFRDAPALGRVGDQVVLKPEIAAVIRAGYDPVLPVAARDPSHALRLAARIGRPAQGGTILT